jgi:hypothetical protein
MNYEKDKIKGLLDKFCIHIVDKTSNRIIEVAISCTTPAVSFDLSKVHTHSESHLHQIERKKNRL